METAFPLVAVRSFHTQTGPLDEPLTWAQTGATIGVVNGTENSQPTGSASGHDSLLRIPAVVARVIGYMIYAYLVVVEVVLGLAFALQLLGANPTSEFVRWVYRSSDRAMTPFRGIFEPIQLGTSRQAVPAVFDTSFLFAMVIYGIVCISVHMGVTWLGDRVHRMDRDRARQARLDAYADASESYRVHRPDLMGSTTVTTPAAAPAPTVNPHPTEIQ